MESPDEGDLTGLDPGNWKRKQHDRYLQGIERIQSRGITVNGCFILGLDNHTPDIFQQVKDFVDRSGLLEVQITVQTPFPGTPLYEKLKSKITNHDLDYYTFTNAVMPTRMEERNFYSVYSNMLKRFLAHLH